MKHILCICIFFAGMLPFKRLTAQIATVRLTETICEGETLYGYGATGVYRDTLRRPSGDTVRILDLTVLPGRGATPLSYTFNTASDGAGGKIAPLGRDLNWMVSGNYSTGYSSAWVPASLPANYASSRWPDCDWIAHSPYNNHNGNQDYYYKIEFPLSCYDSCGNSFDDDSTLCLMLDLLADNSIYEIYVNDIPQSPSLGGIIPVAYPYSHYGYQNANMVSVALCTGWKRGLNKLIVHIKSSPGYAGFLAQASLHSPPPVRSVHAIGGFDTLASGPRPDTGCAPLTVYPVNHSWNATDIYWDFGDGSPVLQTDSPVHTYQSSGIYTLTLVAANTDCGSYTDTFRTTVAVYDYPGADLGRDSSLCGDSLLLQPLVSYPDAVYRWSTGDTGRMLTVRNTGTYSVEIDVYGCTGSDTVSVTLIPDVVVDLGPDRGVCLSELPLVLQARQQPGTFCLWSNGLSDTLMEIRRAGTFWLYATNGDCADSDTIHIEVVQDPYVYAGHDSVICAQIPYVIGTEVPGASYRWNTGAATGYIEADSTGTYILAVNLDGCVVRDTVVITAMQPPGIDLGEDRDICSGATVLLNAGYENGSTYNWSTGDTGPVISVTEPGDYTVEVLTAYSCTATADVRLSHYPLPELYAGADTTICDEAYLRISATAVYADSVIWSDGTRGTVLNAAHEGVYVVTGFNKCGSGSDTVNVNRIFCDIEVPTAFTPNGDGVNDRFRVLGSIYRMNAFRLSVFNRWGQQLFVSTDPTEGWDGSYRGSPAGLGTYVYLLEYNIDGRPYVRKGNFHLIH